MLKDPPAWLPSDDRLRRFLGDSALYPFYRLKLTEYLSRLLPQGPCSILDVGAGDGSLGLVFQTFRPATHVVGIEVTLRAATRPGAQMVRFDGRSIPFADESFDVSLVSNVIHHASDPGALLRETRRVTRKRIIVKDHLSGGRLDDLKLAALDVMGNLRLGAQVAAVYLTRQRWNDLFASLPGVRVSTFERLPFRRGLLEVFFSNSLEVIFTLDIDSRRQAARA